MVAASTGARHIEQPGSGTNGISNERPDGFLREHTAPALAIRHRSSTRRDHATRSAWRCRQVVARHRRVRGIATGKPLLDEKVWEGELRCLYFNGEDSGTEMLRRIYAFCLRHGIAEQDLGRLLVAGADDWRVQRTSFLRTEKGNSVLDEAGLAHFETVIESLRPDTVVVDPLVAFCGGGNINDNAVMALLMRALKRLAGKYDFAGLLIHHTRKGADLSNAEAISGASAIVNLARRAIMTVPMTAEEAKLLGVLPSERSRYFKVVAAKSNLAPRSDDAPWYELCSITLPNAEPPVYTSGDGVQAVARVKLPLVNSASATAVDQNVQRAILDTVEAAS